MGNTRVVLAGDIGGTNARLALFEGDQGPREAETYTCRDFKGLEDVLREYLRAKGAEVSSASLGIAGVITGGGRKAEMVNLGWKPEAPSLASALGIGQVLFLNDLEAAAWGVEALAPESLAPLLPGEADPAGNRCLISSGTGLGEAGMVRTPTGYLPFRTEGGHVNFAPRNALEIELLEYLLKQHAHVSYERVVSGMGLANLYRFMRDTGKGGEPAWLAERMRSEDPGKVVTECAESGESELCSSVLDLFVSIYGSAAGNLALKTMATGGVFLGGGIAPRILPRLKGEAFREAFLSKGRLRPVMEQIPVKVVLDGGLALLGSARAASRLAPPL